MSSAAIQRTDNGKIRLVLPKGRQQDEVIRLLADAGVQLRVDGSGYRPACNDPRFEVKLLKAANIPQLVEYGAHDLGLTGRDWVHETGADVEELLDTRMLGVRIVAAAPAGRDPFTTDLGRPLIVASEYEQLTRAYMERKLADRGRRSDYRYVRTYGATEVFPPEDADLIVDNSASGATLQANGLAILDELMVSSTRIIACRQTMADPAARATIEELVMLIRSILDGRRRVLLDMNVTAANLPKVLACLPAMKTPTVQQLHGEQGFAVRAAVLRDAAPGLLVELRRVGATDILQSAIQKVIA